MYQNSDAITTAHSIPHNVAIRQANLSNIPQSQVNSIVSNRLGTQTTPIQHQALELYNLGLNVFPQLYGKKAGLPWRQLQYTRLHPDHPTLGVKALFQGKCNIAVMCGRTSGNLFVIDCETPDALNYHMNELHKRSIPLWVVETARGGHIYLQCTDGEIANIESGILPDAEIRGCRAYVLTAGSIHPTGVIYSWMKRDGSTLPSVSAKTIDWLTDKDGKPIRLKLTSRKGAKFTSYSPLSRATQDYLANGDLLAQGSRNNRLFSAACDMAGNDYDINDVERQLVPIAKHSGLPENEIFATIRSAFSRQRKPARPHQIPTKKEQPLLWKHALTFAETHQWQGRTGTSDKLLFLALIERAKAASNENGVFRASTRELSAISRTSINTTQKALKRLQTAKYVFYAGQDTVSQASLWKFSELVIREGQSITESLTVLPPWTSCSDSIFNSTDAAERGALGYTGLSVYKALLSAAQPMMPSALAAFMAVPVHRVNYALKKLSGYGLVRRESAGWRALAADDKQLDERVALPSGKLGRGAARRRRYAAQRALYMGRLILRARIENVGDFFLREHTLEQMVTLDSCSMDESSLIVKKVTDTAEESVKFWKCPNCGQVHFAEVPPDMCDFCHDFTTWKPLDDDDAEVLSDPVVVLALELGAEVYMIEGSKRRLIAPVRPGKAPTS